jgi:GWxTD domain-containing protein
MRCVPLLFALAVPTLVWAQPASSNRAPVDLTADYATFMYQDEATLVEIYLGIGARSVQYARMQGAGLDAGASGAAGAQGFGVAVPVNLVLRPTREQAPDGAAAQPTWTDTADLRFVVGDTAGLAAGQYFVHRVRTAVPPGEYTLEVTVPASAETGRSETRLEFDPVVVPDYSSDDAAAFSGLTLATSIRGGATPDDPFARSGLVVVPNPNAVFGDGEGRLNFYAEAYGIPETSGEASYTLMAYIAAADEPRPLPGLQQRATRPARDPDVLVGSFNIGSLPSGPYFLRLAALDAANEAIVEQSKRFFVLNPHVQPAVVVDGAPVDLEERFFAVMPPDELELHLEQVEVIATQPELRQIRGLATDEGRRTFLAQFWRSRDEDADLTRNVAREEFAERIRYVERYGQGGMVSWQSDRGRAILRYGYPSEVDPRPHNTNLAPHEVWYYDNVRGQGRALMVFADRELTGRYELIHSTVVGEVSAPNWEEMLQR